MSLEKIPTESLGSDYDVWAPKEARHAVLERLLQKLPNQALITILDRKN